MATLSFLIIFLQKMRKKINIKYRMFKFTINLLIVASFIFDISSSINLNYTVNNKIYQKNSKDLTLPKLVLNYYSNQKISFQFWSNFYFNQNEMIFDFTKLLKFLFYFEVIFKNKS